MPTIHYACVSDRGRTHPENEDRWFADPSWGLFIVSDGMAIAEPAQFVVDWLPDALRCRLGTSPDFTDESSAEAVRAAIAEVSQRVHEAASNVTGVSWLGLGATIVLALVNGPHALLAHLGDSRIYWLRDGQLQPMTRDHSYI